MTGTREAILLEATNAILDARRTVAIADLPPALQPRDMAEVAFVQDSVAAAYGAVGGYKIGAPTAEATPSFAPMPSAWIASSGAVLSGHRFCGVEAEVAFLLAHDLPPRSSAYTRDEVLDAVASCHPAIEVLESAFVDPLAAAEFARLGDLQMHGGFVYGPAYPGWRSLDFTRESVAVAVDGSVRVERTGSNTSGDLLRLLPFLANEGAARTGGLRAGQWITTGSWTGNTLATNTSSVDVTFSTLGRVTLRFA